MGLSHSNCELFQLPSLSVKALIIGRHLKVSVKRKAATFGILVRDQLIGIENSSGVF